MLLIVLRCEIIKISSTFSNYCIDDRKYFVSYLGTNILKAHDILLGHLDQFICSLNICTL